MIWKSLLAYSFYIHSSLAEIFTPQLNNVIFTLCIFIIDISVIFALICANYVPSREDRKRLRLQKLILRKLSERNKLKRQEFKTKRMHKISNFKPKFVHNLTGNDVENEMENIKKPKIKVRKQILIVTKTKSEEKILNESIKYGKKNFKAEMNKRSRSADTFNPILWTNEPNISYNESQKHVHFNESTLKEDNELSFDEICQKINKFRLPKFPKNRHT